MAQKGNEYARESGETARPTPVNSPRKPEFSTEDGQRTPVRATMTTHTESETDGDERESLSSAVSSTSDDGEDGDGEDDEASYYAADCASGETFGRGSRGGKV